MSGMNGDKSRFNRDRKQKIARRLRNRELLRSLSQQNTRIATATKPKGRAV